MVRTSYIVSGRDLRVRPRNRPDEPTEPGHPDNPTMPGPYPPESGYPYPPENGDDGDYEDAIHPPPPHVGHAPGLYVGPTKGNPVIPVPAEPDEGEGEHVKLPPGAVWPKAYGRVAGHYVALAYIPEHGWRYIVIDPDAWPKWPEKDDENGGEQEAAHPDKPTVPEPATRRPPTTPGRG